MLAQDPPFKAKTMEGLYRKVIKGKFKRIPRFYSDDLNSVIRKMVVLKPNKRPDCDELLNL